MGDDLPENSNLLSSDAQAPVSGTCEDEDQDEDEMLRRAIDLSLTNDDARVCEPPLESKLENYQYSPLPTTDKTIRLLCIPPEEQISKPLVCQMRQVRLIDKPEYAALSYTWGAPIFDHHLICDGRRLAITAHLDAALRRFRTTTWWMLWVDALCIDQTNIPERNYQVSIMKHIYSQAKMTFVYLGESSLLDEEALQVMIFLTQVAKLLAESSLAELEDMKPLDDATSKVRDAAIRFRGNKNAGSPGTRTRTTDQLFAGFPRPQRPGCGVMHALLSRPWFSRIWIIQEILLSPYVVVMLGEYRFDWKLVTDYVHADRELGLGFWHATLPQDPTVVQNFVSSKASVLGLLTVGNDSQRRFIKLLSSFRKCHSSDLRDKVYALLGLADDQPARMITIDYSKSVEAVYLECAELLVKNGDGMEMLEQAGISGLPHAGHSSSVRLNLPSWVPDWSQETIPMVIWRQEHYRAGGETQADMGFKDHGIGLNAKGIRIDAIHALAPLLAKWNAKPDELISYGRKANEVAQQSRFFSEGRIDHWAMTLALALGLGSCNRTEENNGYTSVELDTFLSKLKGLNWDYAPRLVHMMLYHKFCVTRQGYMGWVPASSLPGDFIIVLYGGSLPFTVRETNGKYILLGVSYLEGFMYGAALKLENAGPEDFILQ